MGEFPGSTSFFPCRCNPCGSTAREIRPKMAQALQQNVAYNDKIAGLGWACAVPKKTGKYQSPPQKTVSHMIKGSQIVCLIGWPIVTSTQLSSTTTGRFTGKRHRTVMVQLASARRTHRWMKETRDHRVVQHGGDRFDSAPLGC